MAALAVRPLEEVKVYSLRRESRESFAREAAVKYGIPIQAVDTPEECVEGADIISGRTAGRNKAEEVTCFYNNDGLGLQFAAVGSLILAQAKVHGKGVDLPREWFTESVHP